MADLRRFEGKRVVVTGASSSIGVATARAFAREGAHLALVARRSEHLALLALEIRGAGGDGLILPIDASDVSGLPRALEGVYARLGAIDVLVNAGVGRERLAGATVRPAFAQALRLELALPFALTCLALARAQARGAAVVSLGPRAAHLALGGSTVHFVRTGAQPETVAAAILRCVTDA